jgi:hypothetical protein
MKTQRVFAPGHLLNHPNFIGCLEPKQLTLCPT